MRKISIVFVILTSMTILSFAEEKPSYTAGGSFNLMGVLLGYYGGMFEAGIAPWMSISADFYYSGNTIDNNGYAVFYIGAMPRFYIIGGSLEGLWAGMGAGVKFVSIKSGGTDYSGTVPMLSIAGGYKIVFGGFFIEPYGGYSAGLSGVNGQPSYTGSASLYGVNMGILF
ncbi:MAG: hypothetical protein HPY53_08695 [Brevinematales bacterium]|nr:hypothetical protein [Brevinematales bacterium]